MNLDVRNIAARARDIVFLVRGDREARSAVNLMLLTVAASLLAFHAAQQFFIRPMEKRLARLEARVAEAGAEARALAASSRDVAQLEQMQKRKAMLDNDIRRLETELAYRRQHWRACSDAAAFNRVIFTTGPVAPFRFSRSLAGMSRGKTRSNGPFRLHPVRLEGTAPFGELVAWLAFLENRPEVGGMDDLNLVRRPDGRVGFALTITRRELAGGAKK